MPGNQSRPRRTSVDAGKTSTSAGLQLLSPTLQQSIQSTTSKQSSAHPAEHFGWSNTPPAENDSDDNDVNNLNLDGLTMAAVRSSESTRAAVEKSMAESDFDGLTTAAARKRAESEVFDAAGAPVDLDRFTLASVRERTESNAPEASRASTRQSSHTTTSSSRDQQPDDAADYCAFYYDENTKPNPLSSSSNSTMTTSSTDDYEMSRQRLNSVQVHQRRRTSVVDPNRGTFQLSATAAAAGFPMAKKKELTAVAISGWLQKRKGLVLKRWKTYYCLFKSDDTLCLYTSEDTVNGKLEQRYQVLRVVLTDKNDSFHIIGVDADGEPRREEFRASVSTEWARWFQVLGKFFDSTSMAQALVRKPELTFTKTVNETESSDWADTKSDAELYDERRSYFSQRKQTVAAVRDSFDGSGTDNPFMNPSTQGPGTRSNDTKLSDCPMIESSHATVPILENRPSESQLDAELISGFSWTK